MEWGLKKCGRYLCRYRSKSLNKFQNISDKIKVAFLKATTNIVHKWRKWLSISYNMGTTQECSHSDWYLMYTGGPSQSSKHRK